MGRNQRDEKPNMSNAIEIQTSASDAVENNGSQTITISNVGPAGIGTATIGKWLKIYVNGTLYYVPMWT